MEWSPIEWAVMNLWRDFLLGLGKPSVSWQGDRGSQPWRGSQFRLLDQKSQVAAARKKGNPVISSNALLLAKKLPYIPGFFFVQSDEIDNGGSFAPGESLAVCRRDSAIYLSPVDISEVQVPLHLMPQVGDGIS
ncbi:hypothetical protein MLD38_012231 [Melastoma candidum]|uniref:Uncharacterized protein n=1 Tax=Melastoma candidum TaxID=119954 RepID=A0ACB9R5Q8_9MYRT|nr:hypothetical protein MLD38_012231 [Melastoma candidum]